jgi:cell division protein FtsL
MNSDQIVFGLITAFAVPSVMAVVAIVKRGSTTQTKDAITELGLQQAKQELGEVKNEIKDLGNSLTDLTIRLTKVERNNHNSGSNNKNNNHH